MRVLVEQRFFALNGAVAVEQIDLRWRSRERRARVAAHAREQLAPAQKAHELAYIAGVGGDAFGDGVACERLAIFGEGDKAENVHSVAELGGIFHSKPPF